MSNVSAEMLYGDIIVEHMVEADELLLGITAPLLSTVERWTETTILAHS